MGTFDCRRQDCKKVPGQDCGKCGMPEMRPRTSFIINLYNRCRKNKCLPYPGSVMEQPVWIMSLFDSIDEAIDAHRRKVEDERRREKLKRELEGDLSRRTGK